MLYPECPGLSHMPCRFTVSVSGGPGSSAGLGVSRRGVYMRQPHEAAGPANYTVTITPTLHEVRPGQLRHKGPPGTLCVWLTRFERLTRSEQAARV